MQQVAVKASNVYPKDAEAPQCGVDDMTKLAYLHEPGVLQNLRSRYDMNEIYVRFRANVHIHLSMYGCYFSFLCISLAEWMPVLFSFR